MRFRKPILAKPSDLIEQAYGKILRIAALAHPTEQFLAEVFKPPVALPGPHRTPELIGLARTEARRDYRQFDHLLLKQGHAQRPLQHAAHGGALISDFFFAIAPAQIGMHHFTLNGSRPNDGDLDHQVVVAGRFQARQHRHLRARFDLKHADSIGALNHGVSRWLFGRNIRHPERHTAIRRDQCTRAPNRRQHAET